MRKIYYHTHASGARLKDIGHGRLPPKSVYTDLPRQFCFQEIEEGPGFVESACARRLRALRKKSEVRWFVFPF